MTQNHRKIYRKEKDLYLQKNAHHLDAVNQHRQFQSKYRKNSIDDQFPITSHAKLRFDFNRPSHVFLFSVFAFSAIQGVASTEIQEIEEQVRKKTINDGKSSAKACEKLQNNIIETIDMKRFNNDYMKYPLNQENFYIICTDDSNQFASGVEADFSLTSQNMTFYRPETTAKDTIRHEFYHAYNFFYHKNGKCHGSNIAMFSPVYPPLNAEIKQYNEAFDQGDKRIEHFINLLNKAETGNLNGKDKKFYEKYSNAFSECISQVHRHTIDLNKNPHLRNYKKNQLIDKYTKMQKSNGYIASDVEMKKDELVIIFTAATLKASVEYFQTNLLHRHEAYKKRDKLECLRIGEREAYTFESLSREAQEVFYPEALELQKVYRARCAQKNDIELEQQSKLEF